MKGHCWFPFIWENLKDLWLNPFGVSFSLEPAPLLIKGRDYTPSPPPEMEAIQEEGAERRKL